MNKSKKKMLLWLLDLVIVLAGVALDQFTKYLAVVHLKGQEAIVLIPGALELRYLENRGAPFGMMQGGKVFFLIITPIVLAAILYTLIRMPAESKYNCIRILLSCIAVGAIGNMIDRIRLDYVVDFIYISLIDFPIFNVADMFVSLSCVVGAMIILFGHQFKDEDFDFLSFRKKQEREEERPKPEEKDV